MDPEKFQRVVSRPRLYKKLRGLRKITPFIDCRTTGRSRCDKPLQFATHFNHQHLLVDVDFGDLNPVPADDGNKTFPSESLHGLTYRCATNADPLAQHYFRPRAAGLQLKRDNQFFQLAVSDVGQPFGAFSPLLNAGHVAFSQCAPARKRNYHELFGPRHASFAAEVFRYLKLGGTTVSVDVAV